MNDFYDRQYFQYRSGWDMDSDRVFRISLPTNSVCQTKKLERYSLPNECSEKVVQEAHPNNPNSDDEKQNGDGTRIELEDGAIIQGFECRQHKDWIVVVSEFVPEQNPEKKPEFFTLPPQPTIRGHEGIPTPS